MRFALSLLSLLFVLASSIFLNAQEVQIVPGMENYSNPSHFINDNDTLYFKSKSGIFRFDGSKVDSIVSLTTVGFPIHITIFKNKIYFSEFENNGSINFPVLYEVSKDGQDLKKIKEFGIYEEVEKLFEFNNKLIIATRSQIFDFDGDSLKLLNINSDKWYGRSKTFRIFKNKLIMALNQELFEYDGSKVRLLYSGAFNLGEVFQDEYYFTIDNNQVFAKYDGKIVRKINVKNSEAGRITAFKVFKDKIVFMADVNPNNSETFYSLFEFDGVNKPQKIKELEGNSFDYWSIEIVYNKKLYLSNYDHVVEYDGVNPPREILGDDYYWIPKFFFDYGDRMIFVPVYSDNGIEPWYMKKDGTIDEIADIYPGIGHSFAENFFLFKGVLHFTARNLEDTQLYRYRPCFQKRNNVYLEACAPVLSPSGNEVYDKSGVYSETLSDSYGCDSVVYTHLNIHEIDETVGFVGNMLISNQSAENYKWLDCNNNYAVVANGTSSKFYVNESGSYAVELTVNGCVDTTECIEINYVGIDDDKVTSSLTVYPNPSQGTVYISSMNVEEIIGVRCIDVAGMNIPVDLQKSGEKYVVTFLNISSGIYFLKCQMKDNRVETVKLFIASER